MSFFIASVIVAVSCTMISFKTLVGYGGFHVVSKLMVLTLLVLGWFAPVWVSALRRSSLGNSEIYNLASLFGYFLFGAVFILFTLLILRDVCWFALYGLSRLFKLSWDINPKNETILNISNFIIVGITLAVSFYAAYEALRIPDVKEVNLYSEKLTKEIDAVVISDLHINRATPPEHVRKVVERINGLRPDVIFLVGDIFDDRTDAVNAQAAELKKLRAVHGVYFAVGNHEFYNGLFEHLRLAGREDFKIVFNNGYQIPDLNLFVSGIPDYTSVRYGNLFLPDIEKAMKGARPENYRVMLSHTPSYADLLNSDIVDVQFSGHTHGGQIFPFHFLAEHANKYLAGLYKVNGMDLYVSRGAGYWGPPMRLLAPAEITLVRLRKPAAEKVLSEQWKEKEIANAQNAGFGL